jgi:hypothetical protein
MSDPKTPAPLEGPRGFVRSMSSSGEIVESLRPSGEGEGEGLRDESCEE